MKKDSANDFWDEILKRAVVLKLPTDQSIADHCEISLSTLRRLKKGSDKVTRGVLLKVRERMGIIEKPPASIVEPSSMNLERESYIEIKGRVWATPDRISIQALKGRFIKGYPGEHSFFGVEIEGDSMFPAFVPGDIAIVKPMECELSPYSDADDANVFVPYEHMRRFHNKDAVVEHNEESMLKRIQVVQKGGPKYEVQMLSLNDKYPTIKVRFGDVWRMRGLVVRIHKPEVEV